jgi:hypothetical protein
MTNSEDFLPPDYIGFWEFNNEYKSIENRTELFFLVIDGQNGENITGMIESQGGTFDIRGSINNEDIDLRAKNITYKGIGSNRYCGKKVGENYEGTFRFGKLEGKFVIEPFKSELKTLEVLYKQIASRNAKRRHKSWRGY